VDSLGQLGSRTGAAPRQRPLRWLIVGEIALAVVVLVTSALVGRTLLAMQQIDVGLDTERVIAAEVSLPISRYPAGAAQRAMFDRMVERVAAMPGVEAAGVVDTLPLSQSWSRSRYRISADGDAELALTYRASRDYFGVVGIPLVAGRLFEARDATGQPIIIVSASVARRHWPGGTAVGRRIWLDQVSEPFTVVGVVGDVHHTGLGPGPEAGLYFAAGQVSIFRGVLVARTSGDPRTLIGPMRRAVAELDPTLPLFNTRTIGDLRDEALASPRLVAPLTGLFAVLALVLGVVGVYGIVAFSVTTRRRETGIRMALGARPADVSHLFLRQGLRLAALGLAIGLAAAAVTGRVLAEAAPEVPPPDAATLGAIALILALAVLAACALPVRRALRVDPTEVMRSE
jgi:predicted permease